MLGIAHKNHIYKIFPPFFFEAYEKVLEAERPTDDEKKAKLWDANKLKLSVQKILLEGETNETEAACLLFTMQKLSEQEFYKEARAKYPMIKVIS